MPPGSAVEIRFEIGHVLFIDMVGYSKLLITEQSQQLQKLLSIPGGGALIPGVPLTPALLRLDPMFDPLRNDPRFQKLVASPAPKHSR